ncbi:hypothetical protein E2C01_087584 [Portunus trituberculatus]|uniref:Uncharacterized protein n=1 Tax=Portunus trituberculatus TaxID=210409 RepID=A0A5B7JDR8_PORTR|nr:hypothetical protein [Portunus trituberculatus]
MWKRLRKGSGVVSVRGLGRGGCTRSRRMDRRVCLSPSEDPYLTTSTSVQHRRPLTAKGRPSALREAPNIMYFKEKTEMKNK